MNMDNEPLGLGNPYTREYPVTSSSELDVHIAVEDIKIIERAKKEVLDWRDDDLPISGISNLVDSQGGMK